MILLAAIVEPVRGLWADQDTTTMQATVAAEAWLALIDGGNLEEAWAQTAPEARACSTGAEGPALRAFRSEVGRLQRRQLRKSKQHKRLAGLRQLEAGKYVELVYDAAFEHGHAKESVVLLPTAEGWQVQRYCVDGTVRK